MIPFRSLRALTLTFLLLFLSATLATAFGIYCATPRATDHLALYFFGFGSIIAIVLAAAATFALIVRRRIVEMRRTLEDVRNTSNGVAHELRTPLARLRNQLNLIAHDPRAEAVRDRVEDAQAQADGLLALFSALLRIAEVDSGARQENFAPVDLGALLEQGMDALEPVVEDSGHRIAALSLEPVSVTGDAPLLSQMIVNLVENALRHTPAGTEIRIALSRAEPGWAKLTVADNGPGIAAADRARALDRFGRLPGQGKMDGHGLGLPLVASIARLHGGSIELGDARPGLRVTILLPAS